MPHKTAHPQSIRSVASMPKGRRIAALTLIDQGVSSLSNFAVGVVIARVVGASGLGGFALAYAGWLIVAALDRSLITDPMAINGDVRTKRIRGPVEQGLAAELLMGIGGGVILAAIGCVLCLLNATAFGIAMLALAPGFQCWRHRTTGVGSAS